jgi:uncharacterized membrane protein
MGLNGSPMRHNEMKSTRLEAFSDGVIAIIVTIMVLELHVPHEDGIAGLWSVAPRLGMYLLSFLMVGIYWINHHELVRRCETVDYGILWANLIFLFGLSVVPYFTDYVSEKHFSSFSVALYAVSLVISGATFYILRAAVMRRQKHIGTFAQTDRAEAWKHTASLLLYLVAIPVAYRQPMLSISIDIVVTLIWIIPEIGVRKYTDEAAGEISSTRSRRERGTL